MKSISMSKQAVEAHQRHHGFNLTHQVVVEDAPGIVLPKNRQNKTEAAFGLILEAQKRRGEVLKYSFQSVTLRLGDDCRYTPDFMVERVGQKPELIEIKGGFVRDDALVKYKVAKEMHDWADFSMWQKFKGEWRRLH